MQKQQQSCTVDSYGSNMDSNVHKVTDSIRKAPCQCWRESHLTAGMMSALKPKDYMRLACISYFFCSHTLLLNDCPVSIEHLRSLVCQRKDTQQQLSTNQVAIAALKQLSNGVIS